ncbi:uncharacterized protein LY89DRAFT_740600 [Mollisia scopiformis]|uniref:Uncharacterized protein n=1 Tax=Mollisia scopiformis TaxID=149040 RepID=A0A132BDY4_MOLSC|nr:uncharacterized protein LY89DRAFT_740600 [Mollisia scopiformis]KUJ10209.1 hypothetical protein LY89DRAFT_740600 [Mollisia scopiformis]
MSSVYLLQWIVIAVLLVTVLVLIKYRNSSDRQSPSVAWTSTEDKIHAEEQIQNNNVLQKANEKLARELRYLCREGGPVSSSRERLQALEACQTQLRATERVLQDTQSKLIILEHGKSVLHERQRAEGSHGK